jgi:excisionase family DNA binding protein
MTPTKTYSKYFTVEEVAEIMRMSVRNIQKLCNEGKLGSTRTGKSYLIPQESLDEYLKIRR